MKNLLFKIALIAIVTFGFNGCYTIVWIPGSEFPTEDNSSTSVYYGDAYYGDYYYFYDYPWWWDFTPPVSTGFTTGSRDENTNILIPRNSDGRGTPERIPEVQPPSRNAPTGTGDNGSSGDSGSTSSETRVNNSSSSGSGSSSGRESSSNSGNTTRNNDGGRSSGGRK